MMAGEPKNMPKKYESKNLPSWMKWTINDFKKNMSRLIPTRTVPELDQK